MAAEYQSEASLENQLLRRLEAIGYRYVNIPDQDTLNQHFRAVLSARNATALKGTPLSDREFRAVLNDLIGSRTHYQIAQLLRGSNTQSDGKIVIQRDDNSQLYLQLFNGRDFTQNTYEVTHQMTILGRHENRYDVMVLLNGLPIAQVELKRHGVDFTEAFSQIIRYRNESQPFAKLLKTIQLYVISNGLETRYFANGDGDLNSNFMFYWTDEKNNWINDIDAFAASFFDPQRFHSLIARYTIFDSNDQLMMIMRPYQIFATEAIIRQANEHPERNGYVWHTTGSGKTVTSFKASRLLTQTTKAEKVIFLIDRVDLDEQTAEKFGFYLPETTNGRAALEQIDSTATLVKQLSSKNNPLIVTTIQKLSNAVENDKYKAILTPYHDKKVAFIEDEAHRSQFGEMRKNVNHWFQNAQHFGFTGTPIFKENIGKDGRTTADLYDDLLHEYLIKDAIRDHNVLGFSIQYINTIKGKGLITDDTEVAGIDTKAVFEAEDRMRLIVQHILLNHDQFTKGRHYNAIFTVPNTRMALKYYQLFRELDPTQKLKVTTIFTWKANERDNEEHQQEDDVTSRQGLDSVIADYNRTYNENFSTDHFDKFSKDVSNRMTDHNDKTPEENIDVLIVVNMFLTGFDSRRLDVLYVDRKLQWHSLIQAYSRTNRVESASKPYGNIIAYRNLKQATDEAVTLYSDGNKEAFYGPTYAELDAKMRQAVADLKKIVPTPMAVDELYNQGDQAVEKFVLAFRQVLRIYNQIRVLDEFSWDNFKPDFDGQQMEDYRGKYYTAYERIKPRPGNKVSIMQDIDFQLSLFQTDVIDVAYIVNLIRTIDLDSPEGRDADSDKIRRILKNADDEKLKSKAALLQQFLDEVIPTLSPKDNVGEALEKFMAESQAAAIAGFAKENNIDEWIVKDQINDYEFLGHANDEALSDELSKSGLGIIGITRLRRAIGTFVSDTVKAFDLND